MSASLPKRGLLAAAAGASLSAAKMSQVEAKYQATPRGGLSCVGCTFFRRPASCQVVKGTISRNGWCRLFDLPD
jgi:hypothetical protein